MRAYGKEEECLVKSSPIWAGTSGILMRRRVLSANDPPLRATSQVSYRLADCEPPLSA